MLKFVVPPLVEGPHVMFVMHTGEHFPFAMKLADGSFGLPVTNTVTTTWFIIVFLAVLFWWGLKDLKIKPTKKQVFFELLFSFYDSLVEGAIGKKKKKKYALYIATLITFLVVANTITFFPIPGVSFENGGIAIGPLFRGPTADMNTTVGLALITTVTFLFASISTRGFLGYLKGLAEPNILMFPLNVVGEFAKPINISMRLFGNMFAGMVILGLLYMAAPAIIPAPLHLYFDLFSGIVQSYVFTMLTMVYISSALAEDEVEV